MPRSRIWTRSGLPGVVLAVGGLAVGFLLPPPLAAQRPAVSDTLRLSMADAVRLALERNPALRLSLLDVDQADAEVREARGGLLPRIATDAQFTRDIRPIDPFAGTQAGRLVGGQEPSDWLLFNERARTDGNPSTQPLPLPEFQARQERAFEREGVSPGSGGVSPFNVPNQLQAGLSFSQAVLAPGSAAQLRTARIFREAASAGLRRQAAATADSAQRAYLGALLANAQAEVRRRGTERSEAAAEEAARRVAAGTAAITERLASQVEAANLRTELLEARLQEEQARNSLKLALGLSPIQPLVLTDALVVDDGFAAAGIPLDAALARAVERRADLEESRLAVAAQRASVAAARGQLRPSLNAVVNVNLAGNVPDDRDRIVTDPFQPFEVDVDRRGVLSSDFWDLGLSAGLQLQWNLFQGGQLRAQVDQARVGAQQAEIRLTQTRDRVVMEVENALLEMRTARDRVLLQQENVELAERSFEAIDARVRQGVATAFERREASEQLDAARLNLVRGTHDYLAARSRFFAAVGMGPGETW